MPSPPPIDLARLVGDAATLAERGSPGWIPESDAGAAERLARWEKSLGGPSALDKRLAWRGEDPASARRRLTPLLGRGRWGGPLPAWTDTLLEVLAEAEQTPPAVVDPSDDPVPFEELYAPHLVVFERRLAARVNDLSDLLGERARADLRRTVLGPLARIALRTLESRLRPEPSTGPGPAPRGRYLELIGSLAGRHLADFVAAHPVIGRLWAEHIDRAVLSTAEMLDRLRADAEAISAELLDGTAALPLASLAELGDAHRGGRMVHRLTAAGGSRFLYKPRSLWADRLLAELFAELSGREGVERLAHVRVLDRASHGFVEFVLHRPLADRADAERFYRRIGALDAILYFLGSTDVHHENLIAALDMPVLIDTETLLQAQVLPFVEPDSAARQVPSVLSSGLLPGWHEGPVGFGAIDTSGLGGVIPPGRRLRLVHINTDWMSRVEGPLDPLVPTNRPSLRGEPLSPTPFEASIVEGFRAMTRVLLADRGRVLGLLERFAGARARVVLRDTQVYGALLKRSLGRDAVQSGADRSLVYELVTRAYLVADRPPPAFAAAEQEIEELERLDVPIFEVEVDRPELRLADGRGVGGVFSASCLERARAGLDALSPADTEAQVALLRASLYAFEADPNQAEPPRPLPPAPRGGRYREQAEAAATQVAARLLERAVVGPRGELSWIGTRVDGKLGKVRLQAVGDDLGDGATGPAILFAALHRVTGLAGHASAAERALAGLLTRVSSTGARRHAAEARLGGAVGLGSHVYALTLAGRLLGRPEWVGLGGELVREFDPVRLLADAQLDVLGGTAGLALGFAAYHRVTGDPIAIERLRACGDRLLAARADVDGRPTWTTVAPRPLAGFSHGAAGISLALDRIADATGVDGYRAGVRDGLGLERALYSPERGNWPDRRTDPAGFMVSWCHGAPGIGLARLSLGDRSRDAEVAGEIAAALDTSRAESLEGIDHLCCGNFGRLDFHLGVARRQGRAELLHEVEGSARRLMARAEAVGGFYLLPGPERGILAPGMWQGLAGVGYEILRIGWPDELPSVLAFEVD